jgi:hypothetical protein
MEKRAIEIFAYFFLGYFTDTNGRTKPEWKHQRPHQRKTCSHVRTKNKALEITAAYKCLVSLLAVWHWPSNYRKNTAASWTFHQHNIYIYITVVSALLNLVYHVQWCPISVWSQLYFQYSIWFLCFPMRKCWKWKTLVLSIAKSTPLISPTSAEMANL